jgi:ABC-type multidrug transport system fused ATPase/permease subunit
MSPSGERTVVLVRRFLGNLELGVTTIGIVAVLVGIRALLWAVGVEGLSPTALSAGIITGGVFVLGLVVAGTLGDYRDAERAPTDIATGLYSILREGEQMHRVWGTPDLSELRRRLIAVVTTLRADIDAGDTRTCQAAIEDLSETFVELDESDVPANYIVRMRSEQAGLRKSLLRVYHLQREEFLPSAYAMIVTFVSFILALLLFTNFDGLPESLVTVGFLSFFFLALLRLLNIISTPFKVGTERTDDDVSLFLLHEFVVQVQASEAGETVVEDIEEQAEEVEEQLVELEEEATDATTTAERATSRLTPDD